MDGFWYLATPYSKYPKGLEAAFQLAVAARGLLLRVGVPCFSPIIHSHPVAMQCGIDPFDHSIWLPSEAPILARAAGLIMLRAESWDLSYGMAVELESFQSRGLPVVWMDPGVLPPELGSAAAKAAPQPLRTPPAPRGGGDTPQPLPGASGAAGRNGD